MGGDGYYLITLKLENKERGEKERERTYLEH